MSAQECPVCKARRDRALSSEDMTYSSCETYAALYYAYQSADPVQRAKIRTWRRTHRPMEGTYTQEELVAFLDSIGVRLWGDMLDRVEVDPASTLTIV